MGCAPLDDTSNLTATLTEEAVARLAEASTGGACLKAAKLFLPVSLTPHVRMPYLATFAITAYTSLRAASGPFH